MSQEGLKIPDKGPREGSQNEGKGRVEKRHRREKGKKKGNCITIKGSINACFSLFLTDLESNYIK